MMMMMMMIMMIKKKKKKKKRPAHDGGGLRENRAAVAFLSAVSSTAGSCRSKGKSAAGSAGHCGRTSFYHSANNRL